MNKGLLYVSKFKLGNFAYIFWDGTKKICSPKANKKEPLTLPYLLLKDNLKILIKHL